MCGTDWHAGNQVLRKVPRPESSSSKDVEMEVRAEEEGIRVDRGDDSGAGEGSLY